jgi:hypothetical protein
MAAQKPIAWVFELAKARMNNGEYCDWGPPQLSFVSPCVPAGSIRNLQPLYAPDPTQGESDPGEWVNCGDAMPRADEAVVLSLNDKKQVCWRSAAQEALEEYERGCGKKPSPRC